MESWGRRKSEGLGEPQIQILPVSPMSSIALDRSSINLSLFLDLKIKDVRINQFLRFLHSDKMIP